MGTCVICGTDVDGHVCASHEEDVCFSFTGNSPDQLTPNRFYRGTVDGYADFGVFIDIGDRVTGLLHRSELPHRLESLEWEPGDAVYVQVTKVRDNGNVDLAWSIRQAPEEFRGQLVHTPEGDELADGSDDEATTGEPTDVPSASDSGISADSPVGGPAGSGSAGGTADGGVGIPSETRGGAEQAPESGDSPAAQTGGATLEQPLSRSDVAGLADEIGSPVRLEGEVVDIRQTGGPTIFELRDETGVVDCAAFKSPGVRAYPDVEVGDVVRVDGVVEDHRGDVQVETDHLGVLEDDERDAVVDRLEAAIAERAEPGPLEPLAEHPAVEAVGEELHRAATAIRRAAFEARPVVIRHRADVDGYVAAAAIEHAVLPLVRDEHEQGDAEYHYVDRRPLEDRVYGLADAIRDVTRQLDAQHRHGEKVPLYVFVGAASTAESVDALDLLAVYGADRIVVDAGYPDEEAAAASEVFVSPHLVDAPDAETATSAALGANLGSAINPEVREALGHLPAVSYWREAPSRYVALAEDAGYDVASVTALREAITLEAFYQIYEDKRELVADLLFGDATLAEPASSQFRSRLDAAVRTAQPHLEDWSVDGATLGVLDVDAFTHRYDFPPADVLLAALAEDGAAVDGVIGVDADELTVWSHEPIDLRRVADAVTEAAPAAGVEVRGGRDGSLVFLSGERDAVLEAAISAVATQL